MPSGDRMTTLRSPLVCELCLYTASPLQYAISCNKVHQLETIYPEDTHFLWRSAMPLKARPEAEFCHQRGVVPVTRPEGPPRLQ